MNSTSMMLASRHHAGLLLAATLLLAPVASKAQPDPAIPGSPQKPTSMPTYEIAKMFKSPQEVAQQAVADRFIASTPGAVSPDGHYANVTTFIRGSSAVTVCEVGMTRPPGTEGEWHVATVTCHQDDSGPKLKQAGTP